MLEFTLKNGSLFKSLFANFVNEIVDCVLMFNEDGMTIQAMDSSHVSLVYVKLTVSEMFDNYKCTEPHSLGVSIPNALKVLKLADKSTKVTFNHKTPDANTLTLGIVSSGEGKMNFMFDLNLMNIDKEGLQIPQDMMGWSMTADYKDVSGVIKNMGDFGDALELCIGGVIGDEILYQIIGDHGKVTGKIQIVKKKWIGKTVAPVGAITMKLSMRHMKSYMTCRDLSDSIELFMGPDIPLCITYRMGEESVVTFYVAPKITEI
jgi:proliferating cell nuclear antigen